MSWLDEMKTDALAIADPDFELEPGDEIHVEVRHAEDYTWSSVTFEPGYFAIDVAVWRPTAGRYPGHVVFKRPDGQHYYHALYKCYLDDEAQQFFVDLMNRAGLCTHLGNSASE